MKDRLFPQEKHESQRGYFSASLYEQMSRDEKIRLICIDLGYGIFNHHFNDFPERCINTGAREVASLAIAAGMAQEGLTPVVYSITPFLLYRGFEVLRNHINKENLHVVLAGSGRDNSYEHDGFSHDASDVKPILDTAFPNIHQYWPGTKEDIPEMVNEMLALPRACFISLKR